MAMIKDNCDANSKNSNVDVSYIYGIIKHNRVYAKDCKIVILWCTVNIYFYGAP